MNWLLAVVVFTFTRPAGSEAVLAEFIRGPELASAPIAAHSLDLIDNTDIEAKRVFEDGQEQLLMRQYQHAAELFGTAAKLKPGWSLAWVKKAEAESKLGRFSEVIVDCNRAITVNPGDAMAFNFLGFARYSLNQFEDALFDFDEAIRLNPNYVDAYRNRGNVRSKLKDESGATQDFKMARTLAGKKR
jgi:tetratricopeptide (TPR) repeat protein